jgi:hypothetical protein
MAWEKSWKKTVNVQTTPCLLDRTAHFEALQRASGEAQNPKKSMEKKTTDFRKC